MPMGGTLFVTGACGASLVNAKGDEQKDRWMVGTSDLGAWALVADGISTDPYGAFAAETASRVASHVLTSNGLWERSVLAAMHAACDAVAPWYVGRTGGSTLTIAAISEHRITLASIGDSPAMVYLGDHPGTIVTPPRSGGPLMEWVGQQGHPEVHMQSWPIAPTDAVYLIVTSDGVDLERFAMTSIDSAVNPAATVDELLHRYGHVNDDDSTAVVAWRTTSIQAEPPGLVDML